MVPRDYRYRCFDDCTQVSPRPRPRAKSFFYTRYACQSLCAKHIAANSFKNTVCTGTRKQNITHCIALSSNVFPTLKNARNKKE